MEQIFLVGKKVKVYEDPWTEQKVEFEGTIVKATVDDDFIHALVRDQTGEAYHRKIKRKGKNF